MYNELELTEKFGINLNNFNMAQVEENSAVFFTEKTVSLRKIPK